MRKVGDLSLCPDCGSLWRADNVFATGYSEEQIGYVLSRRAPCRVCQHKNIGEIPEGAVLGETQLSHGPDETCKLCFGEKL